MGVTEEADVEEGEAIKIHNGKTIVLATTNAEEEERGDDYHLHRCHQWANRDGNASVLA